MRVYKFVGEKWALDNLKRRRLKVSNSGDANDLFEFSPFFIPDPDVRRLWKRTIRDNDKKLGFVSFSSGWKNPLMWAHYADSHKGLCYGFDIPDEFVKPVCYISKRRTIPKDFHKDNSTLKEAIDFATLAKSTHWKYEKEFRQFISLEPEDYGNKINFVEFNKDLVLKEVIIGERSNVTSSQIREAVGDTANPKIITSRAAFRSFHIVTQQRKSLWK